MNTINGIKFWYRIELSRGCRVWGKQQQNSYWNAAPGAGLQYISNGKSVLAQHLLLSGSVRYKKSTKNFLFHPHKKSVWTRKFIWLNISFPIILRTQKYFYQNFSDLDYYTLNACLWNFSFFWQNGDKTVGRGS